MTSLDQFISMYRHQNFGMRMGQLFINMFIKDVGSDPALVWLYQKTDERDAIDLIAIWLERHHYTEVLPPQLESWTEHMQARTRYFAGRST